MAQKAQKKVKKAIKKSKANKPPKNFRKAGKDLIISPEPKKA